jgi:nanoRNase/pAp phosphatase (c-di-AMP/oligoRNAs hydrolase)
VNGASTERLNALVAALGGRRRLAICTHNNPDPDGVASAYGLKELLAKVAGVRSRFYYGGVIGRASNRALVAQCRIDLVHARTLVPAVGTALAVVDARPGGANTIVPSRTRVDIVLDHHLARGGRSAVGYADIRPRIGSCATMVTEYLRAAGIVPDKRLATALFFGIRTDVAEFGRGRTDDDLEALAYLFPLASQKLLARIEAPRLPRVYYRRMLRGLEGATVRRDAVVARLGTDCEPDTLGEIADFLIRMDGMRWSLVCGVHDAALYFSLRTARRARRAGDLAIRLVGKSGSAGGHDTTAGGRVDLKDMRAPGTDSASDAEAALVDRFLAAIGRRDVLPQPLRVPDPLVDRFPEPFPSE